MRSIKLKSEGVGKISQGIRELHYQDIDDIGHFKPGEWCYLEVSSKKHYLAFANSVTDKKNLVLSIAQPLKSKIKASEDKVVPLFIKEIIKKAVNFRRNLDLEMGRFFYGEADNLPGLICDVYQKEAFIQINSMGLFRYRDIIQETFKKELKKEIYLVQNKNLQRKEMIPVISESDLPSEIRFKENDIEFILLKESYQKLGHYYDHASNRKRFASLCKELKLTKPAIDLFCYGGSWGFNLLSQGIEKVTFVDQANLQKSLSTTAELNGWEDKFEFIREDVFEFLDKSYQEKKRYKIICSDPPAFTKESKNKKKALEGYLKLHRAILKIADQNAIIAFASCTHYVDIIDFQKTIIQASKSLSRPVRLLDIGIQRFDHPIETLVDRGNYIKYCAYYVE